MSQKRTKATKFECGGRSWTRMARIVTNPRGQKSGVAAYRGWKGGRKKAAVGGRGQRGRVCSPSAPFRTEWGRQLSGVVPTVPDPARAAVNRTQSRRSASYQGAQYSAPAFGVRRFSAAFLSRQRHSADTSCAFRTFRELPGGWARKLTPRHGIEPNSRHGLAALIGLLHLQG